MFNSDSLTWNATFMVTFDFVVATALLHDDIDFVWLHMTMLACFGGICTIICETFSCVHNKVDVPNSVTSP